MILAAGTDPWRWQPHPEVWLLVAGIVFVVVRVVPIDSSPSPLTRERPLFTLLLLFAATKVKFRFQNSPST